MQFQYKPGSALDETLQKEVYSRLDEADKQNDIEPSRRALGKMIFTLTRLNDILDARKAGFPHWMQQMPVFLFKLAQHSAAINQLATPLPVRQGNDGATNLSFDLSSLFVVARAQIECFLTFHYLFLGPTSHEEGDFRRLLFELSGLCNRQTMPTKFAENAAQKQRDADQIAQLRVQIENHSCFNDLENETKKKIRSQRPPARLVKGWEHLIQQSHLKEPFFGPRWKYYSGYAHSEFISSLQLSMIYEDVQMTIRNVFLSLQMAMMITAAAITELLNLAPEIIPDYDKFITPEEKCLIQLYTRIGLKQDIELIREMTPVSNQIFH